MCMTEIENRDSLTDKPQETSWTRLADKRVYYEMDRWTTRTFKHLLKIIIDNDEHFATQNEFETNTPSQQMSSTHKIKRMERCFFPPQNNDNDRIFFDFDTNCTFKNLDLMNHD